MQRYFKNNIVTTKQQWNQQQLHLAPTCFQHYHNNYNDKIWKKQQLEYNIILKYFYMNYGHISDRIFSWKTINNADKCIFFIICNLKILTFQIWQKMLEADFIQFHTSSLEKILIILSTYFYNSQIQVSCANYSFRTHFPSLFQVASYLECQNHQFQQFQHTSLKKSARICLKKKFCNALPEFRR